MWKRWFQWRGHGESTEELQFHLEMLAQQNRNAGMGPAEAQAAARRQFGNLARIQEEVRRVHVSQFLETILQDVRYTLHGFRRTPVFTLTAILTLALAIGGNSAIFSMVRAVLLRPLPWPEPDRLVIVWETNQSHGVTRAFPSSANFYDWKEQNQVFEALANWRVVYFNLSADERAAAERVQGARVAATFLPMLGAQPAMGRGFLAAEEQPGRDRVVILSCGFWQRRFGASRDLLGRQILIDGEPVTVVGILPPEFRMFQVMNRDVDLYMPLSIDRRQLSRQDHSFNVYGRLRPVVSLARAQAEMDAIAQRLEEQFPATNQGWRVKLVPQSEASVANSRPVLLILLAAVGMLLLIACANIANLLLARGISRRKEVTIRLAVGAGRGRIVRQLLTENLLLSLLGGAAGLLLASWIIPLLDMSIPRLGLPRMYDFRIDRVVAGFALVLSAGAGLLFGLAPALQCSRVALSESLKAETGSGKRGRGNLVVFAEVVLTTMLLISAGAALKSALHLVRMNRGLDVHNVMTMQIWLPEAKYPGPPQLAQFFERLLERVRTLPGVLSASVVNYPPLGILGTSVGVEGETPLERWEAPVAQYWVVTPEYFRTVGLPLRGGRLFNEHDNDASHGVVVISERLAERLFPGQDPVGRRLRPLFPANNANAFWIPHATGGPLTIVGMVPDVNSDGLIPSDQPRPQPQVYLPYLQNPTRITHLLVRTESNPLSVAGAVRSEVSALDRNQPVFDIRTLDSITEEAFARQEVVGALLGVFASLALFLAAVGIFGVIASTVGARTREFGIRVALGARREDVTRLVIGQALRPILAGVVAGLAGAVAANRMLSSALAGIEAWDSSTAVVACLLLIGVAAAAACVPAHRAAQADPVAALRCE